MLFLHHIWVYPLAIKPSNGSEFIEETHLIISDLYGSKNGYGLLRGDPNVLNEGVRQMISNEFLSLQKGMDRGYGPCVWIASMSGVWIGTAHFELQPYIHMGYSRL